MEDVREWLDGQAEERVFSGVVLVSRDGAEVFSHAAGWAHRGHRVPNAVGTRFAVASVGKAITAVAALRLVEQGAVGLHQPLTEVLPAEQRPAALTERHTLHHLLSHTSGLGDYSEGTTESFAALWDRLPNYRVRRPADLVPLFVDRPARAEPGAVFEYADVNFVLAGLVLEAVTGRAFTEVVQTEVFDRAGMADSGFPSLDQDPDNTATGYVHDADKPYEQWVSNVYSVTAAPMPDGGVVTTAADLVRFMDALREHRLVSADTHARMCANQGPESSEPEQYGYGMLLGVEGGRTTVVGHTGVDPGVSATVTTHVESGTTVVVLCNQDRGCWAAHQRTMRALGLVDPR